MEQLLTALQASRLSDKEKSIQDILDSLEKDLEEPTLSDSVKNDLLEKLKILGRDPQGSDLIFSLKGIKILCQHGFRTPATESSRQALRCVANAMLLKERARGIPINLGFGANACRLMAEDGIDGEFLGSRILFLSTYAAQDHIIDLIQKHNLAGIIAQNLKRHADKPADAAPTDPLVNMALVDTLNLVFSATHVLEKSHQDMLSQFSDTIPSIVSLLLGRIIPAGKPLDQPIDKLVNALVNFNLADFNETLYPESATTNLASKLVILLDEALSVYSESQMAVMITPLATVILKMLPSAPEEARDFFKSKMLPQSSERTEVLGQGKSLSDRILKNMTNPMAPELRDLLGHITFELSDKDATKLVENIGYGFASGYLFQNKIPVPESMRDSRGDATGRPINPVTGQYVDQETVLELPQMTDEEKEREAERLFVLFERLRQTGVVNVENPVIQAYQSGRIQELGSDEEDS